MAIKDKIRDEKREYDITEKFQKYQHYHLERLLIINILHFKKYYLLIEAK